MSIFTKRIETNLKQNPNFFQRINKKQNEKIEENNEKNEINSISTTKQNENNKKENKKINVPSSENRRHTNVPSSEARHLLGNRRAKLNFNLTRNIIIRWMSF